MCVCEGERERKRATEMGRETERELPQQERMQPRSTQKWLRKMCIWKCFAIEGEQLASRARQRDEERRRARKTGHFSDSVLDRKSLQREMMRWTARYSGSIAGFQLFSDSSSGPKQW